MTVKVSHVPKDLSKEELCHLLRKIEGTVEVSIQDTDQEHKYAWVNCEDKAAAERVVSKLNGASVGKERTMLIARLRGHGGLCGVHPQCCNNNYVLYCSRFCVLQ